MKTWLTSQMLQLVLPLIIGPLAFYATQLLKRAIYSLEKASAPVKQAVVLTMSFVLAGVVKFAGDLLPGVCILGDDPMSCLSALTDPKAMEVLVGALIAFAMHNGKKAREVSTDLFRPHR